MRRIALVSSVACILSCASLDKAMTGMNSKPDEEERMKIVQSLSLPEPEKAKFIKGSPWSGMSEDTLNAMMGGKPKKTQNKVASTGDQKIHLYGVREGSTSTGITSHYYRAIFTNGKMSEFQEIHGDVGSFDKL